MKLKNEIVTIYHNDFDGRFSAFLVNEYANKINAKISFMCYNYEGFKTFKTFENKHVFLVDLTLKPQEMKKLCSVAKKVTWIDHHTNSIDKAKEFSHLDGLRSDTKPSGCLLTYFYLKPYLDNKIQEKVYALISDFDSWQWEMDETKDFVSGLDFFNTVDIIGSDMTNIVYGRTTIKEICNKGKVINKYKDNFAHELCEAIGFEIKFENYKTFVINAFRSSSLMFGSKMKEYDLCMSFNFNGKEFSYSLYSENVDCSKIASKYGGGGHKGASGFRSELMLFKKEKRND